MKRVILSLVLLVGALQVCFAQSDKPATISVYPAVKDATGLINGISEKLLPYQKHITSKSLIKFMSRVPHTYTGDKGRTTEEDRDSYLVNYTYFYVARTDLSKVQSLLDLAREKHLYDTTHYRFLFSTGESALEPSALYVIDLKNPYIIPSLSFTDVRCSRGFYGDSVFKISLTHGAADAFTNLTYHEINNVILFLVDGKLLTSPYVRCVVSTKTLELSLGFREEEGQKLLPHLKAAVVSDSAYTPLYRPQYVLGDTLTYRVSFPQSKGTAQRSHTFQLIPRLVNDSITRMECVVDSIALTIDEFFKENKEYKDFASYFVYELRNNHFMIETDQSSHFAVPMLKDLPALSHALETYLTTHSAVVKPIMSEHDDLEQVAERLAEAWDGFFEQGYIESILPELNVMTQLDNRFSNRQTQGTCYLYLEDKIAEYTITKMDDGLVITLTVKADKNGGAGRYTYSIDQRGLIRQLRYEAIANAKVPRNAVSPTFRVPSSYLIERIR